MSFPLPLSFFPLHSVLFTPSLFPLSPSFFSPPSISSPQGYHPVIFYPKRTSKDIYKILVTQCEKLHITFLSELPSAAEIDADYHVIIDAIFGFSFKGAVRAPFDSVLSTLVKVTAPIASVDVPSGE